MGKYMKKSKIAGDVAVMEVSPQSSLGVRTRAKTLALQRLQKSSSSSSPTASADPDASSFAYLQLRSRRLEKVVADTKKPQPPPEQPPKKCCRGNPKTSDSCGVAVNSTLRESSEKSVSLINEKKEGPFPGEIPGEIAKGGEAEENFLPEGSFGENFLEVEGRDRSTRESTPCSLIRDSNSTHTPGSTSRQRTSTFTNQVTHQHLQRNIPTSYEMEEFFSYAEKQQQTMFMEKYNFDVVNDVPLPGRYEWVPVLH